MSLIPALNEAFCIRMAATLLHFLWQGTLLALGAGLLGLILRRAAARVRYAVYVAVLAFMAMAPAATFLLLAPPRTAAPIPSRAPGAPFTTPLKPTPVRYIGEPPTIPPAIGADNSTADRQTLLGPQPEPSLPRASISAWRVWAARLDWPRLAPAVVAAYSLGVLLMLGRLLLALRGGNALRRRACAVHEPALLDSLSRAAAALRLRAAPALAWCGEVAVPTVVSILRPTILLPLTLSSGLAPEQVELLLLHELAHLRRLDHWINMAQWLVETALFFHPAVWFVSRRIRVERELSCDDMVLTTGAERDAYADSLLRMAEISRAFDQLAPNTALALGAATRRSKLAQRIMRLIEGEGHEAVRIGRAWPLGVLALALALALLAPRLEVKAGKGSAGKTGTDPQTNALIEQVREGLKKQNYRNLYLEAEVKEEDWDTTRSQWAPNEVLVVTRSWYEDLARGRKRIEFDPERRKWDGGAAPYCETRYMIAETHDRFFKIDHVGGGSSFSSRISENKRKRGDLAKTVSDLAWRMAHKWQELPGGIANAGRFDYMGLDTGVALLPGGVMLPQGDLIEGVVASLAEALEAVQKRPNVPVKAREVTENGRKILQIDLGGGPEYLDLYVYKLDPAKEYALVASERTHYDYRTKAPNLRSRIQVTDYHQLSGSGWIPTAWTWETPERGRKIYRATFIGNFDPKTADDLFEAKDVPLNKSMPSAPRGPHPATGSTVNATTLVTDNKNTTQTMPILLLGMRVITLTPELKKKYNLFASEGVLVLDPGEDVERLGIGKVQVGDCFIIVGEKKIHDTREMVGEIQRINNKPEPKQGGMITEGHRGMVRVVYEFKHPGNQGTNTQYLKIPRNEDIEFSYLASHLGLSQQNNQDAETGKKTRGGNRVEGVVKDAAGNPLANVNILIREVLKPGQRELQCRDVSTDAMGRYSCEGLSWPYNIVVARTEPFDMGRGARLQLIDLNTSMTGNHTVNFTLEPIPSGDAGLSGQVLDERGVAVKYFTVSLYEERETPQTGKEQRQFQVQWSGVAEGGKFSLQGLPRGKYKMFVMPQDLRRDTGEYFHPMPLELNPGMNTPTIKLERKKDSPLAHRMSSAGANAAESLPVSPLSNPDEISGTVVDGQGKPLEGVLVDAWNWFPGNETKTGKDGRFRLAKSHPDHGKVELRFTRDGYCPLLIAQQPTGTLTKPVVLGNRTWFEGELTDNDAKPVPGALVRADQGPIEGPGIHINSVWTETRSDRNGRYKLLVQEGRYNIEVQAAGGHVGRLQGITIKKNEAKQLDIPVLKGITFQARVLDSVTSKPVAGVRLFNYERKELEGRSDAGGNLRIEGIPPGVMRFKVEAKGYTRWWSNACASEWSRWKIDERTGWQRNFDYPDFDIKESMAPVTIVVERGVKVTGRILDPDGKPVAGATAAPAKTGSGNSLTGDTRFSVKSKADGTFEMLLPASHDCQYNLVAHDGVYSQWRAWANGVLPPIKTKPGDEIKDVELRLTRPGVVRGKVVDAAGKPVAGREVRASAADRLENRYYDPTTKTDQAGKFELKFVRPGQQYIQVAPFWLDAKEAPKGTSHIVEVGAGRIVDDIQLEAAGEDN